jgi:hypothetical protein
LAEPTMRTDGSSAAETTSSAQRDRLRRVGRIEVGCDRSHTARLEDLETRADPSMSEEDNSPKRTRARLSQRIDASSKANTPRCRRRRLQSMLPQYRSTGGPGRGGTVEDEWSPTPRNREATRSRNPRGVLGKGAQARGRDAPAAPPGAGVPKVLNSRRAQCRPTARTSTDCPYRSSRASRAAPRRRCADRGRAGGAHRGGVRGFSSSSRAAMGSKPWRSGSTLRAYPHPGRGRRSIGRVRGRRPPSARCCGTSSTGASSSGTGADG